jgi:L-amino acid N-acyltransferase YncA
VLGPRPGGLQDGLVTIARGLAGLTEISIEVATAGRGHGAALLCDALALVPYGDPVWACVAPGNVASLRMFLRSGFAPVASVQLVRPAR